MKMGAREFLFLWSKSLDRGYPWPSILESTDYDPSLDRVHGYRGTPGRVGYTAFSYRVTREGSESCDILKKHGLTQDAIDEAVRNYLEDA